jgi:glycosyltransferase involved in cell wall biosynthesis
MARRYPKLGKKFETIYIPFDIEKIRRLADEKNSKKELKLLSEDYFAVVARLSRDKDFDTLILAYKMFLDKTSSKTKLYFAGDGHDRKRLEKMVADYELSKMALFLGQVETPYSLIKNSKALVLSSRNEGAPLTLIEGMILKTIIVSSDCPTAPRELLDDGKCGVLFEPGNAIELKNIMIKIDRNEICREQFSQNIDKWIGRFDINQTIGKYLSIVKQI